MKSGFHKKIIYSSPKEKSCSFTLLENMLNFSFSKDFLAR